MSDATTIIRQANEGEALWFAGGGTWAIKATGQETGGAFFLAEDRVVRGKTTPMHLHANEDESIYVLEGEIVVHVDGEEHTVRERGFVFFPRGVAHAFLVTSETAHLLVWQTPATGESFYREVTEPARSAKDSSRPPDFARLREAAERSPSIDIIGPPPFAVARDTAAAQS